MEEVERDGYGEVDVRFVRHGACGGYIVDGSLALIAYSSPALYDGCPEFDWCPFWGDGIERAYAVARDGWIGREDDKTGWEDSKVAEFRRAEEWGHESWSVRILPPRKKVEGRSSLFG